MIGVAILLFSIPTVGALAAGTVCFLMGSANIPGYRVWKSGAERQDASAARWGIIIGWLGQSVVSVLFAAVLVQLARLFFDNFEIWAFFRWLYWIALFYLCVSPAIKTLQVAEQRDGADKGYFKETLSLTACTTAVGFLVLAFVPWSVV